MTMFSRMYFVQRPFTQPPYPNSCLYEQCNCFHSQTSTEPSSHQLCLQYIHLQNTHQPILQGAECNIISSNLSHYSRVQEWDYIVFTAYDNRTFTSSISRVWQCTANMKSPEYGNRTHQPNISGYDRVLIIYHQLW